MYKTLGMKNEAKDEVTKKCHLLPGAGKNILKQEVVRKNIKFIFRCYLNWMIYKHNDPSQTTSELKN